MRGLRVKAGSGVLFLFLALTLGGMRWTQAATGPSATPLEKVRALVGPSIVYEEIFWSAKVYDKFNKRLLRRAPFDADIFVSCTGFIVNPDGYIVTAGHCVQYDSEIKSAFRDAAARWVKKTHYYSGNFSLAQIRRFAQTDYQVVKPTPSPSIAYGVSVSGLPTGKRLPAQIVGFESFDKSDVALLKIEAQDLPALELAPQREIEVGRSVVAVGYPASVDLVTDATFDPSYKDGSISNIRTIEGGLLKVYEISAAVSGGMSGGPTVDLDGRVIGVNSFGITGETQAFNFIRPASSVAQLMSDKGVKNVMGDVNQRYRAGVEAYFAGDRATALRNLNEVLGFVPSHQFAQEFKAKALRLPLPPPKKGFPVGLLIAGLVAAGIVAAGVFLLVRRSRAPAKGPEAPAMDALQVQAGVPPPAPPSQPAAVDPSPVPRTQTTLSGDVMLLNPSLTFRSGPHIGDRVQIERVMVFGRELADVTIDDPEMSRAHARLRPDDEGLIIDDLDSTNGTWVNETRIEDSTHLASGDLIRLGRTTLEVELPQRAGRTSVSIRRPEDLQA